jgi:hypothetical protein
MGAKAAFGCDYLKAAPNFQKSQFMENRARRPKVIREGTCGKSGATLA